jgi:hypothetical protein
MEKLMSLVSSPDTPRQLRVFATGVLAKLIEGIDLAGTVSTTQIPAMLVKTAAAAMNMEISRRKNPDVAAEEDRKDKALDVIVPSVSPEVDAMQPKLEELHITGMSMRYRELNFALVCLADGSCIISNLLSHCGT